MSKVLTAAETQEESLRLHWGDFIIEVFRAIESAKILPKNLWVHKCWDGTGILIRRNKSWLPLSGVEGVIRVWNNGEVHSLNSDFDDLAIQIAEVVKPHLHLAYKPPSYNTSAKRTEEET